MNFAFAVHTDIGTRKETNQDSLCVRQAETERGNILLAVICDGMGGLDRGELASGTIISVFSNWFSSELSGLLCRSDCLNDIRYRWGRMIKEQNQLIASYGRAHHIQLGSTVTALLVLDNGQFLIGHVGDCRTYRITDHSQEILTTDQTVVANEVRHGRLTPEQAERDPRRNVLLQCIGASKIVEPDFVTGEVHPGECYMLCSDGFRHTLTGEEIQAVLAPQNNADEEIMKNHIIQLTEENKKRGETDNITCVLIKITA